MKRGDGVPVIFRVLKSGQVMALFPAQKEPLGKCASMREVIVRNMVMGTDNYTSVIQHSRPARATEAAEFLRHLQASGMVVSVRKKWTKRDEQP